MGRDKSTRPLRPERILIVDDEQWITEVISEQLTLEGFHADTTTDSSQVMGILDTGHYDLVILDIYMPEPDGLTLLKEIQGEYPFLAVLMLTAFSDAETAALAMREGASDYIVKPYHSAQLTVRIERALERSRLLYERAQAHQLLERRVSEQTGKLREQSKQLAKMLDRVLITYRATLKALEAALDVRDQSAPGHCRRVAKLAVQLATQLGFQGSDLVALEHGALLHDIGKLGIRDEILLKPAPLTEQEWQIMQKHPEIGCQIVGHIDFLKEALPIIRHHHEHYDGTGYPDGLKGKEIPILARIFTVADAFDAQTNQRPYNVGYSVQTALKNLHANKGKLFDPRVVEKFIALIRKHPSHAQLAERSPVRCDGLSRHGEMPASSRGVPPPEGDLGGGSAQPAPARGLCRRQQAVQPAPTASSAERSRHGRAPGCHPEDRMAERPPSGACGSPSHLTGGDQRSHRVATGDLFVADGLSPSCRESPSHLTGGPYRPHGR